MNTTDKVYAIQFNNEIPRVFTTSWPVARKALSTKRNALEARRVTITQDCEDSFTFHYGWAEQGGTWHIVEIPLVDDVYVAINLLGE